ncbi:MAG: type I glyceraldehyde-3-phosphate dehydrogenase [Magnetococcales bacterium]|nr:type I glyceraldehyde-3-phosphate dehydrogenase [Magnetococcales bacterium]
MTIRIGVNGFGRIGRTVFRAIEKDPLFADLSIVAINDPAPTKTLLHLLKYDSVHGRLDGELSLEEDEITYKGRKIPVLSESDPASIPWNQYEVEYVIEATGHFSRRDLAEGHLKGGAKRVVITAPAKGEVKTFVMGVNEDEYDPQIHHIVSNASCTTNCLAPVVRVIMDRYGIERGLMTTIHAYTGDQRLVDSPHSDLRRARAAGLSMIPTRTGAAAAIGLVIPELQGRFDGLAVRVPTADVSLVDVVMEVERDCTVSEINQLLKESANRYLGYCEEPLVSMDFQGDPRSSIVDSDSTRVAGGRTVKVMAWYDNEWGYAFRVLDLIRHMAASEPM